MLGNFSQNHHTIYHKFCSNSQAAIIFDKIKIFHQHKIHSISFMAQQLSGLCVKD